MARKLKRPKLTAKAHSTPSELPTFLEHVYELRRRLFWVVAVIAVVSGAVYPFLDNIIKILTAPLGDQQLYYLTPVGGLSFSIKICVYIGIMAAVPFIMYHLYRYLEPLMGNWRKSALYYVGLSSLLAMGGVVFAYYVSLPGALHFLTGLNLDKIQAMLTVDSYLNFVITYLLGAALLFQIPLLLLIINTMTPLKPGTLKKSQRYVIVGSFIIAALISPTPDMMNQLMFALPILAMYELGVVFVWLQNGSRRRRASRQSTVVAQPVAAPVVQAAAPVAVVAAPKLVAHTVQAKPVARPAVRYIDIMTPTNTARPAPTKTPTTVRQVPKPPQRVLRVPARSIDGFMPYNPRQVASSS